MAAAGHTKTSNSDAMAVLVVYRDVEAVKFLMLSFPAPLEILFFRVHFQSLEIFASASGSA